MRVLCIVIYLILYFFIGIFLNLYLIAVRRRDPARAYRLSNRIVRWGFSGILKLAGVRLHVSGSEQIPQETALYVADHRSYFDILTTHVTIRQPVGYIAKAEMTHIPFLSLWMRNIGCLFLDRKDNKKALKTILEGVKMLKAGDVSLFIFPEGTRGHSDAMAPFKKGSFKMAEKAGVPIVPIGIWGTDDIFENNGLFRKVRGAQAYLNFGSPIRMDELDAEQKKHIDVYVQDKVADLIREIKETYDL